MPKVSNSSIFSEAMFYENYLTSDFHTNTVISSLFAYSSNCRGIEMAAVNFTTIPCEPYTANVHITVIFFLEIRPCTNNIAYARFEVFLNFSVRFYVRF